MTKSRKGLSVGFLFDDTLDSTDGVSQQVRRLGEYLSQHGHKVVYLCGETKLQEWSGGKVYSLSKNIRIRFNGNRLSMPLFSSKRRIRKVLRAEGLDLIHVMTPYSPLMAQRVIAEAKRQNVVVIGSFHILPSGWLSAFGARFLGWLQFFSLRKIQAFTSTSKNAALFARRTMRIKSVVVPNMVNTSAFLGGQKIGNIPSRIVFLGRLVERKGCGQLLCAFAELAKSKPEAELVIAGDGPDRAKLERLVDELELREKVKFLGFIDESDKPKILGSAEIACFPSLYGESFGLVLIEAMAAGAGVVLGGDNPGYRSVLGKQEKLLVNPRNTQELALRLDELLSNKKLISELNQWQQESVKQYDVNIVGLRFVKLYESLIDIKTKNGHNNA